MFAVGHTALGYIIGKAVSKATHQSPDIPLILTLSLLPDIDLIIPVLQHRGPTHSLILTLIAFAPFLITRRNKTLPYLAAFTSHTIIGDYLTDGGVQLLWPLSYRWMTYPNMIKMGSAFEANLEILLFTISLGTMILTKDYIPLLKANKTNLLLFIPIITIISPMTLRYPLAIPEILIIPHLIILTILVISLVRAFSTLWI